MSQDRKEQMLKVSIEQSKLLGSALRVKIIGALYETPKTSKQVATQIGESPGNVHYHIQKLYQGGLIDLVEEKRVGGVVEKYYLAKAKWFDSESDVTLYDELADNYPSESVTKLSLKLQLTEEDHEALLHEFRTMLEKWVQRTSTASHASAQEFAIGMKIASTKTKEK